ncbi:MAG: type IV pilus modification protein PilV [Gammaproteobacteria bacterium]|nr:type IV pilus modification protein PilV [Gammaproteobacteria bacterium]
MNRPNNAKRFSLPKQGGFTLIEVLVSIVVMAIGLLGLAFLQAQGMAFNTTSYTRTQATFAAYDLMDRMRANPVAALTGAYNANAAPTTFTDCDVVGAGCDTAQLAAFDLARWFAQLQTDLGPSATADIVFTGPNLYSITLTWTDKLGQGQAPGTGWSQLWEIQL